MHDRTTSEFGSRRSLRSRARLSQKQPSCRIAGSKRSSRNRGDEVLVNEAVLPCRREQREQLRGQHLKQLNSRAAKEPPMSLTISIEFQKSTHRNAGLNNWKYHVIQGFPCSACCVDGTSDSFSAVFFSAEYIGSRGGGSGGALSSAQSSEYAGMTTTA